MASRGEAVIGAAVKLHKKAGVAAAKGRNYHPLNDIGNLATVKGVDGKPQNQISRPITLANAEAATEDKKQDCVLVNKSTVPLDGIGAGKRTVHLMGAVKRTVQAIGAGKRTVQAIRVGKITVQAIGSGKRTVQAIGSGKRTVQAIPVQNKVTANNPDSEDDIKAKKQEKVAVNRKKSRTFTSVLTARSKAACGLAQKPKEQIVDIGVKDANDDLAGFEYVEDIYKFYKLVENESQPKNYMHTQTEINKKMRAILVDWFIDVHQKFELSEETLYLTINIIDRFLSVKVVSRRELQLVGMGAMLIACKYEELWAPSVNDLVGITDRVYTHQQVLAMEKNILGKLEWTLTVPTHYVFLVRFIDVSIPDQDVENMVYFLAELGMMDYDTLMFCPSMVAASAVYTALCTLKRSPVWTDSLECHTGFSETQLIDCAKRLAYFHSKASENKLQSVYRKYSSSELGAVALLQPAKISV